MDPYSKTLGTKHIVIAIDSPQQIFQLATPFKNMPFHKQFYVTLWSPGDDNDVRDQLLYRLGERVGVAALGYYWNDEIAAIKVSLPFGLPVAAHGIPHIVVASTTTASAARSNLMIQDPSSFAMNAYLILSGRIKLIN
jgi:hypothetical protein